jgi:hypothetical protein
LYLCGAPNLANYVASTSGISCPAAGFEILLPALVSYLFYRPWLTM